ncbi:MAG: hypothetical protein ACRCWF_04660 [Beijerinckiaceae bacterium]
MRPERTTNHADWLKESTRTWKGETKARVIAAAEAVLKHSDPGDITFEYSKSGFSARRKFFIYAVLATAEGEDRWTFAASENDEGASAAVRIVQRGKATAGRATERFRDNQMTIGSFRLFYARLDFMLGKRSDWIACADAVAKLGLAREAPGLQALCSSTHQANDNAPPAKLTLKAANQPQAKGGLPAPPQLSLAEEPD